MTAEEENGATPAAGVPTGDRPQQHVFLHVKASQSQVRPTEPIVSIAKERKQRTATGHLPATATATVRATVYIYR